MLTIVAIIVLMLIALLFMAMPGIVATAGKDTDPLSVPQSRLTTVRIIGVVIFGGALALAVWHGGS